MKKNNIIFKVLYSSLLTFCSYSICFAAPSQEGWDILNELTKEGRTEDEVKIMMKDLGYNTNDYFSNSTDNKTYSSQSTTTPEGWNILNKLRSEGQTDEEIKSNMRKAGIDTSGYFPETNTSTNYNTNYTNSNTTPEGWNILNRLRSEGQTDEEIKSSMEKAGIDTSGYFQTSSDNSKNGSSSNNEFLQTFTSRSCKNYNIEYLSNLGVYSSQNLLRTEYFINADYFKRYIDSKNPQKNGCPTNEGWISNFYTDSSNSNYRYIAPNGKVYFIINQNGLYTSNELSKPKSFGTINELKNYIRDRNPLTRITK